MPALTDMQPEPVTDARGLFPVTKGAAYLDTAALAPGNAVLRDALENAIRIWMERGFDLLAAEAAGERAREGFARLIGAAPADVALIPSVSAAAGFVAAQLGPARPGENVVIGADEFSSNHFPWRMLAHKGYEVRQAAFAGGGLPPEAVAALTDGGTRLIAFSAVQAGTGHRSDVDALAGIARAAGAMTFVDGSQMAGALPVAPVLPLIDVFATSDHKFLLNAMRGVGYCYIRPGLQARFTPVHAGWKAAAEPFAGFFGPEMQLSPTASRFDMSLAWLSAIGDAACLSLFDRFGADAILSRNWLLAEELRARLETAGWPPLPLEQLNRSCIVSVPLGQRDPAALRAHLARHGVVAAIRDGRLRLAVHFFNAGADFDRLEAALAAWRE